MLYKKTYFGLFLCAFISTLEATSKVWVTNNSTEFSIVIEPNTKTQVPHNVTPITIAPGKKELLFEMTRNVGHQTVTFNPFTIINAIRGEPSCESTNEHEFFLKILVNDHGYTLGRLRAADQPCAFLSKLYYGVVTQKSISNNSAALATYQRGEGHKISSGNNCFQMEDAGEVRIGNEIRNYRLRATKCDEKGQHDSIYFDFFLDPAPKKEEQKKEESKTEPKKEEPSTKENKSTEQKIGTIKEEKKSAEVKPASEKQPEVKPAQKLEAKKVQPDQKETPPESKKEIKSTPEAAPKGPDAVLPKTDTAPKQTTPAPASESKNPSSTPTTPEVKNSAQPPQPPASEPIPPKKP